MKDPTPQEIREACRQIQAGWSEAEFRRRAAGIIGGTLTTGVGSIAAPRWTPPVVRGLRGAA
jgi:DNA-binding transcriptional LysR family regulator